MVRLVRHRQTKGPETDRPYLNHRATSRLYPFFGTLTDRLGPCPYGQRREGLLPFENCCLHEMRSMK